MNNPTKILSWPYLVAYTVFVVIVFNQLPFLQCLGIVIFLHQLLSLLMALGDRLPLRNVFGLLFAVQLLIGPIVAFNGGDDYVIDVYKMRIDQETYFQFMIPATLLFILGLNIKHQGYKGERINRTEIRFLLMRYPSLPYYLIGIGFIEVPLAYIVPEELLFVSYLIGLLRYIGVFINILGSNQFKWWPIVLVYGYLISYSFYSGMFHDLLLWSFFLGAILLMRYKISFTGRVGLGALFFIIAMFLQFIKTDFRKSLSWGEEASIETVTEVFNQTSEEKGGMFSAENMYSNATRFNQGFIVSHVMSNVPRSVPFSEGESMKQILFSALFPRFLYPNKLNAGDQQIFAKFSGLQLNSKTSMALSSIGDAYANFGKLGACIFMFLYGLMFNIALKLFYKRSLSTPVILVFMPLIYVYPIRPDCELQTILGHFFKSMFLLLVIFNFYKTKMSVKVAVA